MNKYYSNTLRIISIITLIAFVCTQTALSYEGHLRLQQLRDRDGSADKARTVPQPSTGSSQDSNESASAGEANGAAAGRTMAVSSGILLPDILKNSNINPGEFTSIVYPGSGSDYKILYYLLGLIENNANPVFNKIKKIDLIDPSYGPYDIIKNPEPIYMNLPWIVDLKKKAEQKGIEIEFHAEDYYEFRVAREGEGRSIIIDKFPGHDAKMREDMSFYRSIFQDSRPGDLVLYMLFLRPWIEPVFEWPKENALSEDIQIPGYEDLPKWHVYIRSGEDEERLLLAEHNAPAADAAGANSRGGNSLLEREELGEKIIDLSFNPGNFYIKPQPGMPVKEGDTERRFIQMYNFSVDVYDNIIEKFKQKAPDILSNELGLDIIIKHVLPNAVDAVFERIDSAEIDKAEASINFKLFMNKEQNVFYIVLKDCGVGIDRGIFEFWIKNKFPTTKFLRSGEPRMFIGKQGDSINIALFAAKENGLGIHFESKTKNASAVKFTQAPDGKKALSECSIEDIGTTVIVKGVSKTMPTQTAMAKGVGESRSGPENEQKMAQVIAALEEARKSDLPKLVIVVGRENLYKVKEGVSIKYAKDEQKAMELKRANEKEYIVIIINNNTLQIFNLPAVTMTHDIRQAVDDFLRYV